MDNLSDGSKYALASSVYISSGDVYVAGQDGDKATLWKNGVVQSIADDKNAMLYYSVCVSGNDVYLSGYTDVTDAVYSNGLELHHAQASLWLNGKKLNLDIAQGTDSKAFSIYVK